MPHITIAGKTYQAEIVEGEAIIEGMTAGEFVDLLMRRGDTDAIQDMARLFGAVLNGEVSRDGQSMQLYTNVLHADRTQDN